MMALTAVAEFVWRNWKLIGWGLTALALSTALWFTRSTLEARTAQRDHEAANYRLCEVAHATTRESVETLRAELKRETDEADARARAYQDARVEDAKTVAAANARQNADRPRVAMLEAIAAEANKGGSCKVPPAMLSALEGL